jgi:hypothetical protein
MKSGYDRIGSTVSVEHAKRSCLDKRPFQNKNDARDAAVKNEKRYGMKFRWYRCTLCHGFHLTTTTPSGLQGREQGKSNGARGRHKINAPQYGRLPEEG